MEEMSEFFAARVDGYDEHMIADVEGCREAYPAIAALVPAGCRTLLDLGCGTGLELDEIYKLRPDIAATGIDMTKAMLDRLREKHPDKSLTLICASYFDVDFGNAAYDCAVSCETMHHFSREAKTALYRRIRAALKDGGVYIECDYMVERQEDEDALFAEYARIKREEGIPDGKFFHFDTPFTVENQLAIFRSAGFRSAERVFRIGNTTIIVAHK